MQEITVDTSAILSVLLNGSRRDEIVAISSGTILLAPQSVTWEVGNALSALLKRHRLTVDQAIDAYHSYELISIRYQDTDVFKALHLAGQNGIYAYDAYILQCVIQYHTVLLTLDTQLAYLARRLGIELLLEI